MNKITWKQVSWMMRDLGIEERLVKEFERVCKINHPPTWALFGIAKTLGSGPSGARKIEERMKLASKIGEGILKVILEIVESKDTGEKIEGVDDLPDSSMN